MRTKLLRGQASTNIQTDFGDRRRAVRSAFSRLLVKIITECGQVATGQSCPYHGTSVIPIGT